MPIESDKRPLKICSTCCFWSIRYKGFCHRLEQGAGKFWMCTEWSATASEAEEPLAAAAAAQAGSR